MEHHTLFEKYHRRSMWSYKYIFDTNHEEVANINITRYVLYYYIRVDIVTIAITSTYSML